MGRGSAGKRHQLGGLQAGRLDEEHWPKCPQCRDTMTFYGQLDSLNDEFIIGDVFLICVFACFECLEVKALVQPAAIA